MLNIFSKFLVNPDWGNHGINSAAFIFYLNKKKLYVNLTAFMDMDFTVTFSVTDSRQIVLWFKPFYNKNPEFWVSETKNRTVIHCMNCVWTMISLADNSTLNVNTYEETKLPIVIIIRLLCDNELVQLFWFWIWIFFHDELTDFVFMLMNLIVM